MAGLPPPSAEEVADRLALISPLTARFRALSEVVDELEGATARQLDAIVEVFPAGWARRRAIEILLRAGVPSRFHDALALVDVLERRSERMWALSTLASTRELDEDEREKLLKAAGSPMLARRLRLRLA